MPVRKNQHVAPDGAQPLDDAVGPRADLFRRFSPGAAVAEQLPVRALGVNVRGAEAFILAVIPLDQVGIDFGRGAKAGQFAGADRALQGTGEHLGKAEAAQPPAKGASIPFAALGQWQIGPAGVLPREAPGSFAVPRQVDSRKQLAHAGPFARNGHCQFVISGVSTPNSQAWFLHAICWLSRASRALDPVTRKRGMRSIASMARLKRSV